MAKGRLATLLRMGKPVAAGLALAYLATAFVDRPAPVHFRPENPYAARQTVIVEPLAGLVVEKNILKLGSPLTSTPKAAVPEENPLMALEPARPEADNATAPAAGEGTVEAVVEPATPAPAASPTPGAGEPASVSSVPAAEASPPASGNATEVRGAVSGEVPPPPEPVAP